jgi:hypothetical protein
MVLRMVRQAVGPGMQLVASVVLRSLSIRPIFSRSQSPTDVSSSR